MGVRTLDLVLGGGGVRGIAHVGALRALDLAGWEPYRVAGASAGAMAGALAVAGATPDQQKGYLAELDYKGFVTSDLLQRLMKRSVVGPVVERFSSSAVEPLAWFDGLLAEHGVRTWADLAIPPEAAEDLPPERRYRLVVRCLDVVNRRVVRLPWDYADYGLDADEQSVAHAVRASMSVPLVFSPVPIGSGAGRGLLIDGGLGSGFPARTWDRPDGTSPRPTLAVRLIPRARKVGWPDGDIALIRAVLDTMLEVGDQLEPISDRDEARTVRIDASSVTAMDITMSADEEMLLHQAGLDAMERFLRAWDPADG